MKHKDKITLSEEKILSWDLINFRISYIIFGIFFLATTFWLQTNMDY